jgi:Flp pilus assembly protein TadB
VTLLRDIVAELLGMFLADARLSVAILLLVLVVAALVDGAGLGPLIGGAALLIGCIAILVEAAVRESRRRKRETVGR